jgi:hypothetical protein
VARFMVWARESGAVLGVRRTIVTIALSAVAAGLAVWWTFSNFNVVVQALVAALVAGLLTVFFVWVESGWLVPDAVLVTGHGPPFDDPALGAPGELAFAKKIRVRAMTNEPLVGCRVTMTNVPGGPVTLGWADGGEEVSLRPGDDGQYVLLPTGRFPAGDHEVFLEVTHTRSSEATRWAAHLAVQPAAFPTVVLVR